MWSKRYEEEVVVTKAEMLRMAHYLHNKYYRLKEGIEAKEREALCLSVDDEWRRHLLGITVIMETEAEKVSRQLSDALDEFSLRDLLSDSEEDTESDSSTDTCESDFQDTAWCCVFVAVKRRNKRESLGNSIHYLQPLCL